MITLDQLVPANHLVRKMEAAIDFSFIYTLVQELYSTERGVQLVSGEHVFIDSIHVKASTNKRKFEKKVVRKETKAPFVYTLEPLFFK